MIGDYCCSYSVDFWLSYLSLWMSWKIEFVVVECFAEGAVEDGSC